MHYRIQVSDLKAAKEAIENETWEKRLKNKEYLWAMVTILGSQIYNIHVIGILKEKVTKVGDRKI